MLSIVGNLCTFLQSGFSQSKLGNALKMSKRKSTSADAQPTKRLKPVEGEEGEDINGSDGGQEDQLLSKQVGVFFMQHIIYCAFIVCDCYVCIEKLCNDRGMFIYCWKQS